VESKIVPVFVNKNYFNYLANQHGFNLLPEPEIIPQLIELIKNSNGIFGKSHL